MINLFQIRPQYFKLLYDFFIQFHDSQEKKEMTISTLLDNQLIKDKIESIEEIPHFFFNSTNCYWCDPDSDLWSILCHDDLNSLQILAASPVFNINEIYKIKRFPTKYHGYVFTAIQSSACLGAVKCFKFLLMNGANLDINGGITHLAVCGGNIEIIRILDQYGHVTKREKIEFAIVFHHIELFNWFLERFPNCLDDELHELCIQNRFIHGLKLFKLIDSNQDCKSACSFDFFEYAYFLVNSYEIKLMKPLESACIQKNYFIVNEIIKENILTSDEITKLLITSCQSRFVDIIQPLLRLTNANINNSSEGKLPLITCAHSECIDIFSILINEPGIDINQQDSNGDTALLITCKLGRIQMVEMLVAKGGVDPNIENEDSDFALLVACRNGFYPIVDILLDLPNIDINKRSSKCDSYPLKVAITNEHSDIIELLFNMEDLAKIGEKEFRYLEPCFDQMIRDKTITCAFVDEMRDYLI